jgi:hypothetical protein
VCRADNERCTMTRRPAVSRELRLCQRVAIVQVDARRSGTVDLPLWRTRSSMAGEPHGQARGRHLSSHRPLIPLSSRVSRLRSSPRVTEIARVGWTIAGLRRRALLLRPQCERVPI